MDVFPILKTSRLLLRELTQHDWKAVSYLRSDPYINAYVKRPSAKTEELARAFIKKIETAFHNQESYYWCISTTEQKEMIGSISLWNFSDDMKVAEVGYELSPQYQGIGLMTEALNVVIPFAFEQLNCKRVEAFTQYDNVKSRTLLENNSFVLVEGKTDPDNEKNVVYGVNNPDNQQ
jgi:ribosomal-protein-alanine N-acetyltransferase